MNNDQQSAAWLAVFLIMMALWLTYRNQIKAILFDKPSSGWSVSSYLSGSTGTGGLLFPEGLGGVTSLLSAGTTIPGTGTIPTSTLHPVTPNNGGGILA